MASLTLRELESVAELQRCEAIQLEVWGGPTAEVTVALFRATVHAGALVVGAFDGEALLGFAYGFPSFVGGRVGLHSHLLAVIPAARGRGVGRALKWFQRDWCLGRGVEHITWTFDPLQAKNARLNLEHLGARFVHYYPDFYGVLGGALNGALPSDRVLAEWPLRAEPVAALVSGAARPAVTKPADVALLLGEDGEPEIPAAAPTARRVWLELPPQILPEQDFERVLRWRLALREVMVLLLAQGYQATRFVAGGYVLER